MFIYILICVFFLILYAQSAIDKIQYKKENLSWLQGHFKKSILANFVPGLFFALTLLELITAFLFLINIVINVAPDIISNNLENFFLIESIGQMGAFYMSMITLLSLFFGQRIAKDYEGAKTIAIYFTLNIVAIILVLEYLNGIVLI